MNFAELNSNSRTRFLEVSGYLRYISTLEPPPGSGVEVPVEVKVMKGLFYVHLYSALEKTINQVAETTLTFVTTSSRPLREIRASLLAVALQDQIKSVRDCSTSKVLQKSVSLMESANSSAAVIMADSMLAFWLQNIWASTINELLDTFGIDSYRVTGRDKLYVDEVVDKRNAVAHGRDSAMSVGERFRCTDLEIRFNVVETVAFQVVESFREYCENNQFTRV